MAEYINGLPVYEDRNIGARVYNNANISIATATNVNLTFNTERYDTDSIHSTVSNTSRLTANTAGIYLISAAISWENDVNGSRQMGLYLNGSTQCAISRVCADDPVRHTVSTIYELSVGDYFEVRVYQDSGSTLNVLVAGNYSPEFMMQRLG
jgi:hypothetical protein